MKIGIITPNNLWFCPYVQIYKSILDKERISYDILTWCRDGKDEQGCIQYKSAQVTQNPILKIVSYLSFASFVKKTIKQHKYDRLIVFTPQIGIFISSFLKKYYKGKYIFDYRDLSIEQKSYFRKPFLRLLNNSAANIISSPGFIKYLPNGYDYVLSHNFDVDVVKEAINNPSSVLSSMNDVIDVLTIGGIRDYESNAQVIDALANLQGFTIRFVGRGPSAGLLKDHAQALGVNNISFVDYYPKEEEKNYIKDSTFLNIFYPRIPSHDTALSNRFYNSLVYRKPMITTADTTQGYYAAKYKVGIAVKDCSDLALEMKTYLENIDTEAYYKQCDDLLKEFIVDYNRFLDVINKFIKN